MTATNTSYPRTVGDIAREVGVPMHRVRYVVVSRGIAHSRWIGPVRVFDDDAVTQIKSALRRMPASRDIMAAAG